MATTQKLFTEIFRAKSLDGVILLPRIRAELEKGLQTNVLLYGSPGTGKCLDYNEEIDIYLDDNTYNKLKNHKSFPLPADK